MRRICNFHYLLVLLIVWVHEACGCTPGYCTSTYRNFTTLKDGAPYSFAVGYIYGPGSDPSYLSMAEWAFNEANNNVSILPDVKFELYSVNASTTQEVVAATLELVNTKQVRSLIMDLSEGATTLSAEIGISYDASVISVSSISGLLDSKFVFQNMFARLATPNTNQSYAILKLLTYLGVTDVLYVYTSNVYGSADYLNFEDAAPIFNISVSSFPISPNMGDHFVISNKVIQSRTIIIAADPTEGLRFLRAAEKAECYGETYFYIFTLTMARAIATASQMAASGSYPMVDGSIIVVPEMISNNSYFMNNNLKWTQSSSSLFPGQRPAMSGMVTADAANIVIDTLQSLVDDGFSPDHVNGSTLHKQMLNMTHPSSPGEFTFNANADRSGDFLLFNVLLTRCPNKTITVKTNVVAIFVSGENDIIFHPVTYYFYNRSTVLPEKVLRFSDLCSFEMCSYRGNCSTSAKCQCFHGFTGPYCEHTIMGGDDDPVITASWAVPVGVLLFALIVGTFVFLRKRKAALVKEVTEKQRSDIPRSDIKLLDRIGCGASGEVFKAMFRGTEVAVKRLLPSTDSKTMAEDVFRFETAIMCGLRHPNIVMFMGSCFDLNTKDMLLVMEFHSRGSLHNVLHNTQIVMSYDLQIHLALHAAQGMQFLHASNFIHSDLKSHNILLDEKWNARISDFGITRLKALEQKGNKKQKATHANLGTVFWTAPEVLNGHDPTEESDCYAFGVVLWELFHRQEPYVGKDPMVVALEVSSKGVRPEINSQCPNDVQDLIKICWHQEASKRISFQQIVERLRAISLLNPLQSVMHITTPGAEAPTGTVYFVKTEILSAYDLWETIPRIFRQALGLHNRHIRTTMESYGGYEVNFDGIGFLICFPNLQSCMDWCISLQISLLHLQWPKELLDLPVAAPKKANSGEYIWRGLRVRMAIHSGLTQCEKDNTDGRYIYSGAIVDRVKSMLHEVPSVPIVATTNIYEELIAKNLSFTENIHTEKLEKSTYYEISFDSIIKRKSPSAAGRLPPLNVLTSGEGADYDNKETNDKPSWLVKWEDLSIKELSGRGTVGEVHRALWGGREVAVKVLLNQKLQEEDMIEFITDAAVLQKVSHPNLLPFYAVCLDNQHISIVTEYAPRNLREVLSNDYALPLMQRLKIAKDIANGMTYLSAFPDAAIRIPVNFQSHNILLSKDWEAKITDFGQSHVKDLARTITSVSNVAWTAPEVLEGEKPNYSSALYSFGIIMWEIITRRVPYDKEHPIKVISKILTGYRPMVPREGVPQQYKDLMESCWSPHANMRPSWHVIQSELQFIINGL